VSLRPLSFLGLIGVLQQHGLTLALVAQWVALCRARHSGAVTFELAEGRIRSLRATPSARQQRRLLHD
jgi:hypothetical protein